MHDYIKEDVGRTQCIRDIINLCEKLDTEIDRLIDDHYMKFHSRNSNEDEWRWILQQVQEIIRKENEQCDC